MQLFTELGEPVEMRVTSLPNDFPTKEFIQEFQLVGDAKVRKKRDKGLAEKEECHAKSAKDAKDAKHPLRKTTRQTVSQRFVTELPFLPFASRPLRPLCEVCST
jgi:hypothetical protein